MKWHTPDHNGETRADYYKRFNQPCDEDYTIPQEGQYIWDWFWSLQSQFNHVRDDEPLTLTHIELKAWRENLQIDVSPWEIECLIEMSKTWASAMSKEIARSRKKQQEEAEKRRKR